MALIEYRIVVDDNGNATVIQDVQQIGPGDQIRFVSNKPGTVIKFASLSPCESIPAGQITRVSAIGAAQAPDAVTTKNADAQLIFVPELNAKRKTFPFLCGSVDANGNFKAWGGQGGIAPGGGSNL